MRTDSPVGSSPRRSSRVERPWSTGPFVGVRAAPSCRWAMPCGRDTAASSPATGSQRNTSAAVVGGVIGVPELVGESPIGMRTVDIIGFADLYPAARYTEAGDIVFCTSPRVAAWIDIEGGSVVLSPARIIRLVTDPDAGPPPLVPQVVAADIEAAPRLDGPIKDWQLWPLRLVPRSERDGLLAELARHDAERRGLLARLADLDAQHQPTHRRIHKTPRGRTLTCHRGRRPPARPHHRR